LTGRLFATPIHPYSEALLRSVPRPDRLEEGPLATIPGLPPNLANIPPGCPFEARCPVGHGDELCLTTVPPEVTVGMDVKRSVAECHYARERASRVGLELGRA
jgi:oligopeptide/dipeptide ABC transporter ATP-binding protein